MPLATDIRSAYEYTRYFIPRPHEITQAEREKAFARAKKEALANLELRMAHIQSLTYDQFTHERR